VGTHGGRLRKLVCDPVHPRVGRGAQLILGPAYQLSNSLPRCGDCLNCGQAKRVTYASNLCEDFGQALCRLVFGQVQPCYRACQTTRVRRKSPKQRTTKPSRGRRSDGHTRGATEVPPLTFGRRRTAPRQSLGKLLPIARSGHGCRSLRRHMKIPSPARPLGGEGVRSQGRGTRPPP
jgi:hypothetical protein